MNITPAQFDLLKTHGFKWYKNGSTDSVEAEIIKDVVPAVGGLTVVYKAPAVLALTTAKVEKIEFPDDLNKTWIFVHFTEIDDIRLDA